MAGPEYAFAFDGAAPSSTMTDLGILPGGKFSNANAMSGGTIVGYADVATGDSHAVAWRLGNPASRCIRSA